MTLLKVVISFCHTFHNHPCLDDKVSYFIYIIFYSTNIGEYICKWTYRINKTYKQINYSLNPFKCLLNPFKAPFKASVAFQRPFQSWPEAFEEAFQLPCDFFSKALLMPSNSFLKFPWNALQLPFQILIESAKCLSSCFHILR